MDPSTQSFFLLSHQSKLHSVSGLEVGASDGILLLTPTSHTILTDREECSPRLYIPDPTQNTQGIYLASFLLTATRKTADISHCLEKSPGRLISLQKQLLDTSRHPNTRKDTHSLGFTSSPSLPNDLFALFERSTQLPITLPSQQWIIEDNFPTARYQMMMMVIP